MHKTIVLMILDGWGWRKASDHNGILLANTPNWNQLLETYPHALLKTSGLDVGLPDGQMGNSEVGHMNIGAGRVVMQDLPRIDQAVASGTIATDPTLEDFITNLKQSNGAAHLLGLISPGGVHSHQSHGGALAKALASQDVPVVLHLFLDGRDTPPNSAKEYVQNFLNDLKSFKNITIGSMSGRYYAMDRDNRWERVEAAFNALVHAGGPSFSDPISAIQSSYDDGVTDEFFKPMHREGYNGFQKNDGILCFNFRADRVRQILGALLDPTFESFDRRTFTPPSNAVGMTEYSTHLNQFLTTLFPPQNLAETLGEVVSRAGKSQMRLAETEKYPHVTFFFNGGREDPWNNEDRKMIPSPKVATYDLQPEMSADDVGKTLNDGIASENYDLIIMNFANPDMVGHTGSLPAVIKAVETVDGWLGKTLTTAKDHNATLLITADHGNAEQMFDPQTGQPHTAHTTNPVPVVLVNGAGASLKDGRLADIAPTLLALLGIPQPKAMTGHSLLEKK